MWRLNRERSAKVQCWRGRDGRAYHDFGGGDLFRSLENSRDFAATPSFRRGCGEGGRDPAVTMAAIDRYRGPDGDFVRVGAVMRL
jgi:hypothetical protein